MTDNIRTPQTLITGDCSQCPYSKDRDGLWKTMADLRNAVHQLDKSHEKHGAQFVKVEQRLEITLDHIGNRLDVITANLSSMSEKHEKSIAEHRRAEGHRDGVREANRKWTAIVSTVIVIALGSGGFVRFSQGGEEPFYRDERHIYEQQVDG